MSSDRSSDIDALRLGFIGAGRLGTALAWSLARLGCSVIAVASRSGAAAERLAAPISSCNVLTVQQVADACDLVFVTTPDDAIASTVESARWRAGAGVVHCSGATEVAALDKAARDGALTGGFHTLQTFGDPEAAVQSLPGCTITIEASEPLNTISLRWLNGWSAASIDFRPARAALITRRPVMGRSSSTYCCAKPR